MQPLKKVAVVTAAFSRPGPAQSLLDRFLAGYPRDGVFQPRLAREIALHCAGAAEEDVARRSKDFGLKMVSSMADAIHGAEGVVVFPPVSGRSAAGEDLERILDGMGAGSACLVVGQLSDRGSEAGRLAALAASRGVRLGAANLMAVTYRLPEARPTRRSRLQEALIVVQGDDDAALSDGVFGLLPDLDPAPGGDGSVRRFEHDAVWRAGAREEWSWDLLVAALSRSNNPQGDPVKDGRTQDLVGLGLVQRLAERPRAWITDHASGVRSTILALDGVVKDVNLATRDRSGTIYSAQLYQPPAPNEGACDRLAAVAEEFFRKGFLPWPARRTVESSAWAEALRMGRS